MDTTKNMAAALLMVGASCATAGELAIDSSKSAFHVGETVMVCGTVSQVTEFRKGTYLNFGDRYPRQHIAVVVWNTNADGFRERFGSLQSFEGRRACARGEITEFRSALQMKVSNPQFLRLLR